MMTSEAVKGKKFRFQKIVLALPFVNEKCSALELFAKCLEKGLLQKTVLRDL